MMLAMLVAALGMTTSGGSVQAWSCTNQVEVWCGAEDCTVKPAEESTPLSVHADNGGTFSVCAYSGCWEGTGKVYRQDGRLLLTAEGVPFSSGDGGTGTDITLLIIPGVGTGFVRAGGLATPLTCRGD